MVINFKTCVFGISLLINVALFAQTDSLERHETNTKSLFHLRELAYKQQTESFDPLKREINYPILGGVALTYGFIIYQIDQYYKNTKTRTSGIE